jgi:hypothetical protein
LQALTVGFVLLIIGAFGLSQATTLPAAVVAILVRTLGGGTIWVFSAALLQTLVADQFRGRVFSFEFAAFTLTQSIAILWAGMAQDTLGLPLHTIFFYSSVGALVVALLWLWVQWSVQRQPALGELVDDVVEIGD